LFDLSKDISEAKNLASTQPEETAKMFDVLSNYLKSVNAESFAERPQPKGKAKRKAKK